MAVIVINQLALCFHYSSFCNADGLSLSQRSSAADRRLLKTISLLDGHVFGPWYLPECARTRLSHGIPDQNAQSLNDDGLHGRFCLAAIQANADQDNCGAQVNIALLTALSLEPGLAIVQPP